MYKIFTCFLIFLCFSCSENTSQPKTQEILLLQVERCKSDGGNVYIRCGDGRQKIVELGYGKFTLIEDGEVSEVFDFCKEAPLELSINIKNSHVKYKEIKAINRFRIEYDNPVDSVCFELAKIENPALSWEINMELTPIKQ